MRGTLLVLIVIALGIRCSSAIFRGTCPTGYHSYEPFTHFKNPEDTGLLWMYALYTPPRPQKLRRTDMLLRTRSLILILLIIGCVESNPGKFT